MWRTLPLLGALGAAALACGKSSRPTQSASGGESNTGEDASAGVSAGGATEAGQGPKFVVIEPVQDHVLRSDEDPLAFERSTTVSRFSADASAVVGFSSFRSLDDATLPGGIQALRWTEASDVVGLRSAPGVDTTDPRSLYSTAFCVSLDGSTVAGLSSDGATPRLDVFLWTDGGGMMNLGEIAGAASIELRSASSDCRVLVGTVRDDDSRLEAVRWSESSGWQRLGRLPGDTDSQAEYVSADGAIVVGTSQAGSVRQGYRWTEDTGVVSLGQLPGTQSCEPRGVTSDAQVIVGDCTTGTSLEPFRWTEDAGMASLGSVPGSNGSFIRAMSADGAVVIGHFYDANSKDQAYRWTSATGMVELGLLAGYTQNVVRALNADGTVLIGQMTDGDVGVPFRWSEATGLVVLEPLPGDDTTFVDSVSLDGTVVAGLSGERDAEGVGWSVANAVVWDDEGVAHSLAESLTGAGVELNGFHLDFASVAPVAGQTVLSGQGKGRDGTRAWVAWLR